MTVPSEANQALSSIKERFGRSLIAVYLHGSAAAGELRPRSDVDLLAVIDQPIACEARESLIAGLMEISGRYPHDPRGRHPLELIVFLRAELYPPGYPARCELIYGEWLRGRYEAGEKAEPVCDPELTLVLAHARQQAKSLLGPSPNELLPAILRSHIRRAIGDLLPALVETLHEDERNVLLTLARMWRTAVTGEWVSKDAAAEWAAALLPGEQAALLTDAREAYLTGREPEWRDRRKLLEHTARLLHDQVRQSL